MNGSVLESLPSKQQELGFIHTLQKQLRGGGALSIYGRRILIITTAFYSIPCSLQSVFLYLIPSLPVCRCFRFSEKYSCLFTQTRAMRLGFHTEFVFSWKFNKKRFALPCWFIVSDHAYEGQRSQFSSSTMWILKFKLRSCQ